MTTIQSTASGIGYKASELKQKQMLVEHSAALSVEKTQYNQDFVGYCCHSVASCRMWLLARVEIKLLYAEGHIFLSSALS